MNPSASEYVRTLRRLPLFSELSDAELGLMACIGTKDPACVDVCPCDCIHPRKDEVEFSDAPHLYINPEQCIDCGACIPVCPVSAIFPIEDLPNKWNRFAEINGNWYALKEAK